MSQLGRTAPQPDWVGSRVVLRFELEAPDTRTGASVSDAVGELLSLDDEHAVVRTKTGEVTLPLAIITVAKVIPPKPSRRGAPHRALSIDDLDAVMTRTGREEGQERLDRWVLRPSSTVAIGSPERSLAETVDTVEQWYAERARPAAISLSGPVGFDPWRDPLGAELRRRGYVVGHTEHVLTAASRDVAGAPGTAPQPINEPTVGVIEDEPGRTVSVALHVRAETVGSATLGLADAWGGITAVWARPGLDHEVYVENLLVRAARAALTRKTLALHLAVPAEPVDDTDRNVRRVATSRGFSPHHAMATLTRVTDHRQSAGGGGVGSP